MYRCDTGTHSLFSGHVRRVYMSPVFTHSQKSSTVYVNERNLQKSRESDLPCKYKWQKISGLSCREVLICHWCCNGEYSQGVVVVGSVSIN